MLEEPLPHSILSLPAPAKINRYLHITGRRADGYHLLDTEFELIDLCDTVQLRLRDDGQLVLHTPIAGLPDAQHLAMRAAQALKTLSKSSLGADIWVEKRIPAGAGLGGGSSDAATTLMGLNTLWGCGLSTLDLQALGLTLGADVPFFCSQLGRAAARGVGERLQALPYQPTAYVLIYPNCHVSTPAVFKAAAALRLAQAKHKSGFDTAVTPSYNALQAAAVSIAPAISLALEAVHNIESGGLGIDIVRMSGSGSAVFRALAAQAGETLAQQLAKAIAQKNAVQALPAAQNWQVWGLTNLPVHPIQPII